MAKKAKSRMNRKTKRIIRRSIAALLMITAIGVAAIPAKEVSADTVTETVANKRKSITNNANANTTDYNKTYTYDSTAYNDLAFENAVWLKPQRNTNGELVVDSSGKVTVNGQQKDINRTYAISQLSNGEYELKWQFEYYDAGPLGLILAKYNNEYQADSVTLPVTGATKFLVVTDSMLNAFYLDTTTGKGGATYSLDYATDYTYYVNHSRTDYNDNTVMFQNYFPTKYQSFWAACDAYQDNQDKIAAHAKWINDRNAWVAEEAGRQASDYPVAEPEDPAPLPNPGSVDVVPNDYFNADLTNGSEKKKQFYCNKVLSAYGVGFTLVEVNDRVGYYEGYTYVPESGGTPAHYVINDEQLEPEADGFRNPKTGASLATTTSHPVYAVATNGITPQKGKSVDGFLAYEKSNNINGIADQTFQNVGNINKLILPDEVSYIGDEAFVGSFIKEIVLKNVANIGNRAFKGCTQLKTVTLEKGTMNVGKEAFSGSGINSITLPVTTQLIGPGAFAQCKELNTVDLSAISGNENTDIRDYAFYDCNYINNVIFPEHGIYHIGEAAFAVVSGVNGSWTSTVLPSSIKKEATLKKSNPTDVPGTAQGLGNFLFAGRTNLQSVTLPGDYCIEPRDDYAYSLQADDGDNDFSDGDYSLNNPTGYNVMPAGMFKGCSGLKEVIFPDTSSYARFHPYMFLDVTNPDFVIRGPMSKPIDGAAAIPRYSTWNAITKSSDFVPYIYLDNSGKERYEVSDGSYILTAEADGTLTGCTLVDAGGTSLIDMVIPSKVGDTKIKTIASDCFDDATKNRIKSLTFEDDSVAEISPNAFANMKELKTLYVGDSVETIGEKAFYDCNKLEKVVIGNGTKTIGNSAFEDCDALITADIGNAITSVGDNTFYKCPAVTDIAFASPKGGYSSLAVGTDAFKTTGSKLTLHGDIQGGYALFDWATDKNNTIDDLGTRVCYMSPSPSYLRVIYDNNTEEITLVDYPKFEALDKDHEEHCEEMEAYYSDPVRGVYAVDKPSNNEQRAAFAEEYHNATDKSNYKSWNTYGPWIYDNDGSDSTEEYQFTYASTNYTVDPYYNSNYKYSIIRNVNTEKPRGEFEAPTPYEQQWIEATKNIVVPQGVTSIDIDGYINDSQKNSINVQKYLKSLPGYEMYSKSLEDKDSAENPITGVMSVPGLFSGYYKDYAIGTPDKSEFEKNLRGNDSIESITLNSVKKLPDNCFDSCEKLKTVNIGPDCDDIGIAPFRGCGELTTVGGNDNFKYNNGIIYSVNDDGSLTIEECLSSRGKAVGKANVNGKEDPDLANVSKIKDGAFEECDSISTVDLTVAEKLKEIPENAFNDCDSLTTVVLPETVDSIKSKAFGNDVPINVTIPGKEVHIATDAFEHTSRVTIRTYDDSAAMEYAKYHDLSTDLINEKHRVLFFDYDGKQIGEAQYVEDGKSAEEPTPPKHEGMTFTGWSDSPHNVTKDLILIAQYSGGNGGSVSGGDAGNNGSGNGGSGGSGSGGSGSGGSGSGGSGGSGDSTGNIHRVTVVNGSGTGDYLAGRTVTIIANTSGGRTFSNWSSNDGVAFANSTSATTTFTMPDKNVTVTAYFTTSGSVSGNNNGANRNNAAGTTGTRVAINKPGISNTNLASAKVNGSTDDFIVKISETPEATAAVERALTNEYGSLDGLKYFAMDITLWDSNGATKITDTTGLSVDITIPLPDSLKDYAGNNKTAAVVNDYLEPLTPKFTTIDKVPCVTFRATHFSPYAIYVDTGNLSEGTRPDGTPKTADGIHPKWFLSIGLAALSLILFFKRDNKVRIKNI